jgi:hypothetical protein
MGSCGSWYATDRIPFRVDDSITRSKDKRLTLILPCSKEEQTQPVVLLRRQLQPPSPQRPVHLESHRMLYLERDVRPNMPLWTILDLARRPAERACRHVPDQFP